MNAVSYHPAIHCNQVQAGITTEIVHLTPERAAEFLSRMPANRHLAKTNVATLVRVIRDGEWQVGLSTMSFDVHGNLIDGQHRCHAVIEAGIPVDVLVVRGLPTDSTIHMDTGKKRTLADVLSWQGEQKTNVLAGVLVRVAAWRHYGSPQPHLVKQVSRTEALALLEAEPGIRDGIRQAARLNYAVGGSPSMWGALIHILRMVDDDAPEDADLFFDAIMNGAGLHEDDAPYVLRERLLSAVVKTGSRVRGMREDEMAAIVVKAWNAYRRGDRIRMLRWRPGGAKNEPFPQPV